jgi:hypothetical protein
VGRGGQRAAAAARLVSRGADPGSVVRMSSINQFPWQEQIVALLHKRGHESLGRLAEDLAGEGGDVDSLRKQVADEAEHLVQIGLAQYLPDEPGKEPDLELTDRGREAAASLPG